MKRILAMILVVATLAVAGEKYSDLTKEYISSLDINVKRMIARDPQTHIDTLEILSHDNDLLVRLAAKGNMIKK